MNKVGYLFWRAKRLIRNFVMDVRYGGVFLGGTIRTRYTDLGARDTISSEYEALPRLFADLIKPSDILVDVGCGKGRVINWWLSRGYPNRIVGIELDPDIAKACRHRLRKFKNIRIISGNALENIPEDGTLFYLFDPFSEDVMRAFKERMEALFCVRDDIRIVYNCAEKLHLFKGDPNWSVQELNINIVGYAPAAAILNDPAAILGLVKQEACGRCAATQGGLFLGSRLAHC